MISRLKIKGRAKMPYQSYSDRSFSYPRKVDMKFTKGLNVIIGPNGCGKTTAITIMKTFMMVGSEDICSSDRCHRITDFFKTNSIVHYKEYCNFEVYSDYANKTFYMPRMAEIFSGSMSGGNMLSLAKAKSCRSRGESAEIIVKNMLLFAKEQQGPFDYQGAYNWHLNYKYSDHPYIAAHRIPDEGITTVLIDEPDSHLDIFKVKSLAGVLTEDRPGMQLIVVVHNPLLICELARSGKANFIEMEEGYVDKVRNAVKEMTE